MLENLVTWMNTNINPWTSLVLALLMIYVGMAFVAFQILKIWNNIDKIKEYFSVLIPALKRLARNLFESSKNSFIIFIRELKDVKVDAEDKLDAEKN